MSSCTLKCYQKRQIGFNRYLSSQISYQPSYGTQKCYMFITEPAYGWQFAENDCATRGGNLVSVHSDDENDFLLGRIGLTSRGIYWLGLRVRLSYMYVVYIVN